MNLTEAYVIGQYERKGALWLYKQGGRHAILRSQMHSDGFFNSRPIIEDEVLLAEASVALVDKLEAKGLLNLVDGTSGPQTGGTKLAEFVAKEIAHRRGRSCSWTSPKKSADGQSMFFEEGEPKPQPGEIVLLVEDVLTTGGSVARATQAVVDCRATTLDKVLAIVNRSGAVSVGGVEVLSLVSRSFYTYPASECPLCAAGSEAVENPKDNWDKLTGVV